MLGNIFTLGAEGAGTLEHMCILGARGAQKYVYLAEGAETVENMYMLGAEGAKTPTNLCIWGAEGAETHEHIYFGRRNAWKCVFWAAEIALCEGAARLRFAPCRRC